MPDSVVWYTMDVVVDLVVLVCFIITSAHRTQDSWCVAGLLRC